MPTILITGASRGIGLATTQKFLDQGWQVIATHRSAPIPIQHPNLIPIQLDLSSSQSITQAIPEIKKALSSSTQTPQLHALVNNAGLNLDAQIQTADPSLIHKTFEVNLFGLIELTEQLLPLLGKSSHIINIDSLYGSINFPIDDKTSTGYRMSKAALNMYTKTLAFRLQEQGIIVSSLDPGWVKTDMGYQASTPEEQPNREPQDAAQDIYKIVTEVTESGFFWRNGQKRDW